MGKAVTILTEEAGEQSRYRVVTTVEDLDGNDVVPTSLRWSLTNSIGTLINGRDKVSIASPAISNPIILSGNDLIITESSTVIQRILLIEATYTESTIANMPYKHEYIFTVRNFVGVSSAGASLAMPADLPMPADMEMT